jgi:protein gp37
MGADTGIEWAGSTHNAFVAIDALTGKRGHFCLKVHRGCDHCYAERDNNRFGNKLAYAAANRQRVRWEEAKTFLSPLIWTKPRIVFGPSMFDPFQPDIPQPLLDRYLALINHTPEHTYILLTKYLRRMVRYFTDPGWQARVAAVEIKVRRRRRDEVLTGCKPWPLPNLWIGTSPCDQATWDKMVPYLFEIPIAKRLVSVGPMLGPIDNMTLSAIDGVIVEGETGPHARICRPEWVRSARDQCIAAGLPFFFKQWGEWAPFTAAEISALMAKIGPVPGVLPNGQPTERPADGDRGAMWKVGKHDAGRLLDGRTWDQMPERAAA